MKKQHDSALTIHHPRMISAFYFGFLALIGTAIMDSLLSTLIIGEEMLPTHKTMLIGTLLAIVFGAIFGEQILHCERPYKLRTFLLGFSMSMAALPIFAFFYLMAMKYHHQGVFADATFMQMVFAYIITFFQLFFLAGLWVALGAGFAAMFLRGQISYDILHSHYQKALRENYHHMAKRPHLPR